MDKLHLKENIADIERAQKLVVVLKNFPESRNEKV